MASRQEWLAGGGELGRLIRVMDWSATPLGPRDHWPEPLRVLAGMVLAARVPMVLLWGQELAVVYNDAMRPIVAGAHPGALGRPLRETWPALFIRNEASFAAVLERGEALQLDAVRLPVARDGGDPAIAVFAFSAAPVRCDGSVAGMLLILHERHRLSPDSRARETSDRYERLFNAVREGFAHYQAIYDDAGHVCDLRIVDVNPAAASLSGIPRGVQVGRRLSEVWQGVDRGLFAFYGRADEAGQPVRFDYWNAGLGRWFDVVITALAKGDFVVTWSDITDKKITEEALRHSQKMEAVGRLAGGVAHDFNNLLTVILAAAGDLVHALEPGDPRREEALEIETAGQRAAVLTRQLLAFSRKQVLDPSCVNVNELVQGAEKLLRRLLGEDVELVLALEPDVHACRLDRGQFEQVVLNLAVNARDAMPGGGRLTVGTANASLPAPAGGAPSEAPSGDRVVVVVSDTGEGMTDEVRANAFEPFFTTKGPGRGTGLGLATVYGIVRQSGGTIEVDTAPGRGTTFRLLFPRADEPLGGAAEPPPAPRAASTEREPRAGETVLLVEDDAQVRHTLAGMLRRGGYAVLEAMNGEDALGVAERHPETIHALVTDVVLPGMNGCKVAARLQELRPELRALFMSGYADEAIEQHGVLAPGLELVAKPITSEILLAKVREVLET